MIKYFLHGGYVTAISDVTLKFYTDILGCIDKNVINILIIPFARNMSVWEKKIEEVSSLFNQVRGYKTIEIRLANNNPERLEHDISESDVIFMWGGDTQTLQSTIEKIQNLKSLLDGKIIAGSSAGALVLSEYYYENDTDSYHVGLGIIESGMICHWRNQYIQRENIEKIVGTGRVLCIPEGQYIVKEG